MLILPFLFNRATKDLLEGLPSGLRQALAEAVSGPDRFSTKQIFWITENLFEAGLGGKADPELVSKVLIKIVQVTIVRTVVRIVKVRL